MTPGFLRFVIFGLGLVLAIRLFTFYASTTEYIDGQELFLQTTLLSEPTLKGNSQQLSITTPTGDRIRLMAPRYPELHYGDRLSIQGVVKKQAGESGTYITMYYPEITKEDAVAIFSFLAAFRSHVLSFIHQALPSVPASLVAGIVFGIRETMPQDFLETIRTTGVLHVVAASGMNVTLIAGFVSSISMLYMRRQVALVVSIGAIILYALLAGLEASIIRASIMGGLLFIARIIGRQHIAGYGLFLAGWAMVMYAPYFIEDIGFQLSFIATAALIYLKPMVDNLGWVHILRKTFIGEDIATTLSVQIATLPILLIHFGTYSLWSIVVNALVLWTIPFIMIFGGIAVMVSFLSTQLASILIYLSLPFLLYFEWIVEFFSSIGGLVSLSIPIPVLIGYYLVIGAYIQFRWQFHETNYRH